jgi:hypothetical protein
VDPLGLDVFALGHCYWNVYESEGGKIYQFVGCFGGGGGGGSVGDGRGGGNSSGTTIGPAPPPRPPCRIVDPFFAALEFTGKLGPEVQVGPVKAGASLYKNFTTGDTGAKIEANAALVSAQVDNPTPMGGSLGGGTEGAQFSLSFLGLQYNFKTRSLKFSPSKSVTFGLQVLAGAEVSFNSDTFNQVSAANAACRARGGS